MYVSNILKEYTLIHIIMSDTQTGVNTATGVVKWFNNSAGYGFLTVVSDDNKGTDVFVHHTALKVEDEQYRYLVQGEYVDFSHTEAESGDHKFQASNVTGVCGGKLMCETRNENQNRQSSEDGNGHDSSGYRRQSSRHHGGGPRSGGGSGGNGEQWFLVRRDERRGRGRGGGGDGGSSRQRRRNYEQEESR